MEFITYIDVKIHGNNATKDEAVNGIILLQDSFMRSSVIFKKIVIRVQNVDLGQSLER